LHRVRILDRPWLAASGKGSEGIAMVTLAPRYEAVPLGLSGFDEIIAIFYEASFFFADGAPYPSALRVQNALFQEPARGGTGRQFNWSDDGRFSFA
jgi:hypothetical protein